MMNAQSNLMFNEKPAWYDCDYLTPNERASYIIENGTGFHTFDIEIISKDWTKFGDFKVYVNISESKQFPNWSPLMDDTESLYFRN